MCGIIGYVGKQNALPILLDGLRKMEYRGYDSAGVAIVQENHAVMCKAVGPVIQLAAKLAAAPETEAVSRLGIAHTRWATHGGVTEANAHPHTDCAGRVWLVHNGIVENYKELKNELIEQGHKFISETDTEVIAHLIETFHASMPLEDATRRAIKRLGGTYGLAVVSLQEPETLVAVRNFSPLLLGIGKDEYVVASDAAAILKHTNTVVYLDDGEIAVITPQGYRISDFSNNAITKSTHDLDWTQEEAEHGGFAHFMEKEIMTEPEAIENSMRGRLMEEEGMVKLGGLAEVMDVLRGTKRLVISACGTAYFAGRVGKYMIEEYAGIPVEIDIASEFRYRKPVFRPGDVFLAISQSGETADTLAALREAKEKNVPTLGIVNVVGSTIARETDAGVYQHIGPEMGVASTKAFASQVVILALMTVLLGRMREMSLVTGQRIVRELKKIPELMRLVIDQRREIHKIAAKYQNAHSMFFLGRKYQLPVACEGALKLKEISYIHAEGYGAGEMKHGAIAMIDESFPSVCIALQDSVYEKMLANIEEIKARKGPVIAVATQGDQRIAGIADDVLFIPKTLEMLSPLLSVVPLQLLAYYMGVLKGFDVDKPRNLAKSVTVE
ncbi:MAG: glutamine--fructose-6-phosphate transaminase (isomerizing) [Candidatus Sungbacteria bacterium]|nr:glutamine--fructose-6-phosphate transaminase (isomerizing) [Candidatus Sungbacteria bacterium]